VNRDAALGVVMLAVAGGYYAAASALPTSQLDDAVGPQGLPRAYALVLAVLSVVLIAARGTPQDERGGTLPRVAGMLAIGALYVVAAPWLGYVPALAALILVTVYYQGGAVDRRTAVVAVSGALLFWLLFVFVLGIPQPAGFWPAMS
jgi:putative tricarboxylic transport membrane protein